MKCLNCEKDFQKTNNRHKFCSTSCKMKSHGDKYKFSARKSNIKCKYGLSWETWLQMYEKQEGKCLICHTFCPIHPKNRTAGLVVDHCHTTDEVRGLLCTYCNSGIGYLKENEETLLSAILYLRERKKR